MEEIKDKSVKSMDFNINLREVKDKTKEPQSAPEFPKEAVKEPVKEVTTEKKHFPDGIEKLDNRKKDEQIRRWNEEPMVKKNGIRAIDTEKETVIGNKKYAWIKSTSIIGVIALIIIAGAGGIFAYLAWNDGTLLSPIEVINNVTCGDTVIPECPSIIECPIMECPNVQCGACTFPDSLEVTIVNGTG